MAEQKQYIPSTFDLLNPFSEYHLHRIANKIMECYIAGTNASLQDLHIRAPQESQKEIMDKVIAFLKGKGWKVIIKSAEQRETEAQTEDALLGFPDKAYVAVEPIMVKIRYHEKIDLPKDGFKQVTFLVEQEDGTMRHDHEGSTILEEGQLDKDNLVLCKVLVPQLAYVWIDKEGKIFYSMARVHTTHIIAETY